MIDAQNLMTNRVLASASKHFVATVLGVTTGFWGLSASAQVYRCAGNEYTNNEADAKARNCKAIEGANVTIIGVPKPPPGNTSATPLPGARGAPRDTARANDTVEQRARDSDARLILEAELKKSDEKLADLRREYNNGEPEKRGEEFRNNQRYVDRVADIKAAITRSEADIVSLKRELARAPGAGATGSAASPAAVAAPISGLSR